MKIIGHRGAKGLAPENTMASLKKALKYKVDELEFDVRVTEDGIVVLSHDPFLHDASGSEVIIKNEKYDVLKSHRPDLTTLAEVFNTIPQAQPLIVEIKPDEPTLQIINELKQAVKSGWRPENLHVASFDQQILREIHEDMPELPLIVNESWSGVRAHWRARELGTKRITMRSWWLWSGFIKSVARGGYQLSSYTINDPAKAKRWSRYGLYAIVTDFPDRF